MPSDTHVLVVGAGGALSERLRRAVGEDFVLVEVDGAAEALDAARGRPFAAIVVGELPGGTSTTNLLAALVTGAGCPVLQATSPERQRRLDRVGLFYTLSPQLDDHTVRALLEHATGRTSAPPRTDERSPQVRAEQTSRALELARPLAHQVDLAGASQTLCAGIEQLTGATRTSCWFYDEDSGSLFRGDVDRPSEPAARGLVGYVARTREWVAVERVGDDARFCVELDDPNAGAGADPGARLLAVAVVDDRTGTTQAVLTAVRSRSAPAFSVVHRQQLLQYAELVAPLLHLLEAQVDVSNVLARPQERLFRREAVEAWSGWRELSEVLRVSPRWSDWGFWVLVAGVVAATLYLFLGTVHEYVSGPALVRATGRVEVTVQEPGTIAELLVSRGASVEAGEVVARLHDAEELAEFERQQALFEGQLRVLLRNRSDPAPTLRQSVSALRTQRDAAAARLASRRVIAPHAGTISEVRSREGQLVEPGDVLMSIVDDEQGFEVVALLPGNQRPLLASGMPMRLQLAGYPHAYQSLEIDAAGDEVIGPAEARRFLGPVLGDSVEVGGALVLVRARVATTSFMAGDETHRYYDGMHGSVDVSVRTTSIVRSLLPGLDRLEP